MASMHRTTIDIDIAAYEKAAEILGTHGYKETVNAALNRIARQDGLAKAAAYVQEGRLHTPSFEELNESRRPRS